MPRADMSDHLVHFTSGATWEAAFETFCRIVEEQRLIGSGRLIRNGHRCICFSEAPLPLVPDGLVNPDAYSRYMPFGIMVDKSWVFEKGGRPVIYQPDREFDQLPRSMQWRHMRYELDAHPPIDFTWEREWRLHSEELLIDPSNVVLVVPTPTWAARLRAAFHEWQDWQIAEYSLILDQQIAEQYREDFPWRITSLTAAGPDA